MPVKKIIKGVVSKEGNSFASVIMITKYKHPLYGKIIKKVVTYKAYNVLNSIKVGDIVFVAFIRPMSNKIRFIVIKKQFS